MRRVLLLTLAALLGAGVWRVVSYVPSGEAPALPGADTLALPPWGPAQCGARCGEERWLVKTLADVDRDAVSLVPVETTVEALAALPRPASIPEDRRVAHVELTLYRVEAYLAAWDIEEDRDIHIVLAGMQDQRATLIAEISDPECWGACTSGFGGYYAAAREAFFAHLQALTDAGQGDEAIVIRVTGVGFFDRPHGQIGATPNNVELHPVLSVEFR